MDEQADCQKEVKNVFLTEILPSDQPLTQSNDPQNEIEVKTA